MDRAEALRAAARSTDPSVRWHTACDEALPVDAMLRLVDDPELSVVQSLMGNLALPREVVAVALARRPELAEQIALHPQAPVGIQERVPLWMHTQLSLRSYCAARGLPDGVRSRVFEVWVEEGPGSATTLGDVVGRLDDA